MRNLILATDSYKSSHFLQFPENTQYDFSYIESRGGRWNNVLFFGLQAFIKEYLLTPITQIDIDEAEEFFKNHGEPFNREGWQYILSEHGGLLPLSIKAVQEGLLIPTHNILVSVVNTDPKCFWLTGYIETMLLRGIWYPTTVATNSFHCKLAILKALNKSCDDPKNQIMFRLHDFGARGTSSSESAGIGGLAHLVNFMGSDTVEGVLAAKRFYNEPMAAFSIPASEHRTITSWGNRNEIDAHRNMLKQFAKPGALVASVCDSYDLHKTIKNIWGDKLKQEVIDSGATIICRPDSGNPETIPLEVINMLSEAYGYTVNNKGYKVLPSCIRVIQGDGITETTIPKIYDILMAAGFSAENLALGMGAGLLQKVDRDTLRFAMKCSAVCVDDVWHDVSKDPITDHSKKSKSGRLALVNNDFGDISTIRYDVEPKYNLLKEVYRDGNLLTDENLSTIRERANLMANIF